MKKKILCAAALALLLIVLSPAVLAFDGFNLPGNFLSGGGGDFSLFTYVYEQVDANAKKIGISGSEFPLDHVFFLPVCVVGEETELCICEASDISMVLDQSTLPDGCRVEVRREARRIPDAITGAELIAARERILRGEAEPAPADPGQGQASYLYLVGTPRKTGSHSFLFLSNEISMGSVEVARAHYADPDDPLAAFRVGDGDSAAAQTAPVQDAPVQDVPVQEIPTVTPEPVQDNPWLDAWNDFINNQPDTSGSNTPPTPYTSDWTDTTQTDQPAVVSASAPSVTLKASASRCQPGEFVVLEVAASGTGSLSYQWYTSLGAFSVPIDGANDKAYWPNTASAGTYSYFCRVTNTVGGSSAYTDTDPIQLTVAQRKLASVSIDSGPNKTVYTQGERLDTTGLVLLLRYDDGSTERVSSGYSASPAVLNGTGNQGVVVTYQGFNTGYAVTVRAVQKTLRGVGVLTLPNKTTYTVGEYLDPTGLSLRAYYSDNTTQDVSSGFSCQPLRFSTAGQQTVTVTYSDKTCTFTVTVNAAQQRTVRGIAVLSEPYKTSYKVGEYIDTSGMSIRVYMSDGSYQDTSSGFTCQPSRFTYAGNQSVTVIYGDKTASFSVSVSEDRRVIGLSIQTLPANRSYAVGDTISTAGLVLQVQTNNGYETVTGNYTVTPKVVTTPGTQTITVIYEGMSATYTVDVREASAPRATPTPTVTPEPWSSATPVPGSSAAPSASPGVTVRPSAAPAATRRNTGVNGLVITFLVIALAALGGLVGYAIYLKRNGYSDDDFLDAEQKPSQRLHEFFDDKKKRRK